MTPKNITSVLVPKPLHRRIKSVIKTKGVTIQNFVFQELERAVTREESRRSKRTA